MNKPSVGGTIGKTAVAVLFFLTAMEVEDDTVAVALVIGLAFLAWAVLPHLRYRQEMKAAGEGRRIDGKKPGLGTAIAKVTFAALFIIMAFDMDDGVSLLISLVLAAALLFWAAFPFLKYRKNVQAAEYTVSTPAPAMPEKPSKVLGNRLCPFCGAPMTGNVCQYCGMFSES